MSFHPLNCAPEIYYGYYLLLFTVRPILILSFKSNLTILFRFDMQAIPEILELIVIFEIGELLLLVSKIMNHFLLTATDHPLCEFIQ